MAEGRILVVEDDATLVHAVARNLSVRGYTVRSAMTVADALAALAEGLPDLAIVDIDLPDGSGWDVLRALRAEGGQTVPTIAMSALRPNMRLTKELRCSGVLEKPFPMESLLRLVAESIPSSPQPPSPTLGEGEEPTVAPLPSPNTRKRVPGEGPGVRGSGQEGNNA